MRLPCGRLRYVHGRLWERHLILKAQKSDQSLGTFIPIKLLLKKFNSKSETAENIHKRCFAINASFKSASMKIKVSSANIEDVRFQLKCLIQISPASYKFQDLLHYWIYLTTLVPQWWTTREIISLPDTSRWRDFLGGTSIY